MAQKLGTCLRNSQGIVDQQNDVVIEYCGSRKGEVCENTCAQKLREKYTPAEIEKGQLFHLGTCRFSQGTGELVLVKADGGWKTYFQTSKISVSEIEKLVSEGILSSRESEIAKLIMAGFSNSEVAAQLFISKPTVRTHLNNIYKKIGKLR